MGWHLEVSCQKKHISPLWSLRSNWQIIQEISLIYLTSSVISLISLTFDLLEFPNFKKNYPWQQLHVICMPSTCQGWCSNDQHASGWHQGQHLYASGWHQQQLCIKPTGFLVNIYKWKWGRSRWIAYFENYLQKWFGDRYGEFSTAFPTEFFTRFPYKNFPQDLPQNFPQDFLQHFPQDFPTRFSCKIFLQDFPARFSQAGSWLVGSPSPYSKC